MLRYFQKNGKECKECCVLFKRTEKNIKNVAFFSKEQKRTQRTLCSFQKNRKECKECCVLFKRTEKNVKNVAFFSKDRKRTQEFCVLLKRMRAQPCLLVLSVLPFPPFLSALTVLLDLPTPCYLCPHCPPCPPCLPWSSCTVPADLFHVLPVTGLTSPHTSKAKWTCVFYFS